MTLFYCIYMATSLAQRLPIPPSSNIGTFPSLISPNPSLRTLWNLRSMLSLLLVAAFAALAIAAPGGECGIGSWAHWAMGYDSNCTETPTGSTGSVNAVPTPGGGRKYQPAATNPEGALLTSTLLQLRYRSNSHWRPVIRRTWIIRLSPQLYYLFYRLNGRLLIVCRSIWHMAAPRTPHYLPSLPLATLLLFKPLPSTRSLRSPSSQASLTTSHSLSKVTTTSRTKTTSSRLSLPLSPKSSSTTLVPMLSSKASAPSRFSPANTNSQATPSFRLLTSLARRRSWCLEAYRTQRMALQRTVTRSWYLCLRRSSAMKLNRYISFPTVYQSSLHWLTTGHIGGLLQKPARPCCRRAAFPHAIFRSMALLFPEPAGRHPGFLPKCQHHWRPNFRSSLRTCRTRRKWPGLSSRKSAAHIQLHEQRYQP